MQKQTFENERFVRDIRKNAKANRPKRAFRARHSQRRRKANLPKQAFRARHSQKKQKQISQNERLARDICKNAEANIQKGAFCTRHSQKRKSKHLKTSVSHETFAKTRAKHSQKRRSKPPKTQKQPSQNERFVRDIRKNAETTLRSGKTIFCL